MAVLALSRLPSSRDFTPADVTVARMFASRAASALENAQLYHEVQQADRQKNEFLSMLAHELRNPLAPIRNANEVLRQKADDIPRVRWAQGVIDRQLTHLVRLVDDLLDVSRITSGKVDLRKETVDVAAIIERAVETVEPLIHARRQELEISLPSEPIYLDADLMRLAQVVANLLSNAVKYTPEGGSLKLSVESGQKELILRVKDTGMGIPPEMLEEIFGLFTQVGRALDRAQGGLGIGLTLVRSLVQMHGGTVEAFSEGVGKGSEFTVRLPVLEGHGVLEEHSASRKSERKAVTPHRRILVVDDNVHAAETLAMVLKLRRHDVRTANDGRSALRVASDFLPDVVLLDLGLPDLNGFEVARRLRREPILRPTLLIALTGYGERDAWYRAMEAGFDHHLVKPVSAEVLEDLIAGTT
jgi:DNA-binding response OmpR family regulator/anti-sigma regulatory factor (Ser/Thr protein kinase)